jgi:hypothetical protein
MRIDFAAGLAGVSIPKQISRVEYFFGSIVPIPNGVMVLTGMPAAAFLDAKERDGQGRDQHDNACDNEGKHQPVHSDAKSSV